MAQGTLSLILNTVFHIEWKKHVKLKDSICRMERKQHILKQDWVIAVSNRKFRSGVYLGENENS